MSISFSLTSGLSVRVKKKDMYLQLVRIMYLDGLVLARKEPKMAFSS